MNFAWNYKLRSSNTYAETLVLGFETELGEHGKRLNYLVFLSKEFSKPVLTTLGCPNRNESPSTVTAETSSCTV